MSEDGGPPVRVHVHFAVSGTFPLRVADLCFTDAGVSVLEYALVTPLHGLLRRSPSAHAAAFADVYRADGLAGAREFADVEHRVPYADVETVRLYDGGAFGREKIVVDADGRSFAYRVHAPVDLDALARALSALGRRRGFAVERRSGLGFSPRESLARFLRSA